VSTQSSKTESPLPPSQSSVDRKPQPHHDGGSHGASPSSSGSTPSSSSALDGPPLSGLTPGSAPESSCEAAPVDLVDEGLITLAEAAWLCPRRRRGQNVHTTTLYRWATRGVRGVLLEVIDTPSGLCTSKAAVKRFFGRLTAARNLPHPQTQSPRREEHHAAIEAELKSRYGI
jgi:hypothetical protein